VGELLFEINVGDEVDGLTEELTSKRLKLCDGVGGEEGATRDGGRLGRKFTELGGEVASDGGGGDSGGVDDLHRDGKNAFEHRAKQGIMRAAEQERIGIESGIEMGGAGLIERFGQVDASDFGGDGMGNPAFLDEGDEERAGFFDDAEVVDCTGVGVGVAFDGGRGAEDENVAGDGSGISGSGSSFDDPEDRDAGCVANFVQCESGGRVAGDDEKFSALLLEKLSGGDGVACDGALGFRAIRKSGGVSEINEVNAGELGQEGAEDGESTEAGIEDADGDAHGWSSPAVGTSWRTL
jgi:hypothetical protein